VFPVFKIFLDDKIIAQGQTIILSRNILNTGNTFVDLAEQLAQSNSYLNQMCYSDLDYILRINSNYSLFFCLPQTINSRIILA
jgi:hypothetical protein